MNGFTALILRLAFTNRWFVCLVALSVCLASFGCRKDSNVGRNGSSAGTQNSGQFAGGQSAQQQGPSGETIVRDLVARYNAAGSYSDQAVLYLTYLIHGQRIQEPQPWSTTFVRGPSAGMVGGAPKLAAKLFNG